MIAFRGQGAIEFFLIAGFILLATSVLLTQADRQIQGTSSLNNVLVARSALDLEASALRYVYLSGNYTTISQRVFIPVGAQCFYFEDAKSRMYCIVPGAARKVVGDALDIPRPTISANCYRSGWVTLRTMNNVSILQVTCT
ncbi:MAG TPA: hypothetical protein VJI13_03520 [Candidatus Norongarragalinales archaeon]|nr:hypothetical protein [Candidatus Norongarragalinales archaeon]